MKCLYVIFIRFVPQCSPELKLGNIPDAISMLYISLRYGDMTIRAALIIIIGISLAFLFRSFTIMSDTSTSLQFSRNIDNLIDLDIYDSNN